MESAHRDVQDFRLQVSIGIGKTQSVGKHSRITDGIDARGAGLHG